MCVKLGVNSKMRKVMSKSMNFIRWQRHLSHQDLSYQELLEDVLDAANNLIWPDGSMGDSVRAFKILRRAVNRANFRRKQEGKRAI